jgi:hypothetical protein
MDMLCVMLDVEYVSSALKSDCTCDIVNGLIVPILQGGNSLADWTHSGSGRDHPEGPCGVSGALAKACSF